MTPDSTVNDESLEMLLSMGFTSEQASHALRIRGGNLEASIDYLLTEATPVNGQQSNTSTFQGLLDTISGSVSQYDTEEGRSACTCIALTAAESFLRDPSKDRLSVHYLDTVVAQGIDKYKLVRGQFSADHLSAEEILFTNLFPGLKQVGAIRQGVLSSQPGEGLYQTLSTDRSASNWRCYLITKPPETILVCSSPLSEDYHILIDTHPRHQQFGTEHVYARIHTSLWSLCEHSLQSVFPYTDVGSDVPPLMAAMYNTYDVYMFEKGDD